MPLRSVKMNRFILGFQRRVWCPKWVPLSSSCFIVTTAIIGHVLQLSVDAQRPVTPSPGACWMPDLSLWTGPTASGYDLVGTGSWCRHAKSARSSELRLAVYTLDRRAFPHRARHPQLGG